MAGTSFIYRNTVLIWWVLAALFAVIAPLTAQPLRIDYFTVNDGLSTPEINDLYPGKDGFIWVSTMDGLNRFDGLNFRRFGEGRDGQPGLSRSAIAAVRPDNEGRFVVTFHDFYGYFDRFDPRSYAVEQVRLAPSTGVLGYPRAITTDSLGRTFVVTIGSEGTFVYEYVPRAGNDRLFTPVYHEPGDAWTSLTPRVELLPLATGGFLLYDEEHGFRHLGPNGNLLGRPFGTNPVVRRLYGMAEAGDGSVYLSFRDGYALYNWRPGPADPLPVALDDERLRFPRIFRDRRGQLLLSATEDILGLQYPVEYGLVDEAGRFRFFDDTSLPVRQQVSAVAALDFRETVYLGLREGLGVVERYPTRVRTYLEYREGEDLFPHRITGLAEDRDGFVYALEADGVIYRLRPGEAGQDTLRPILASDSTAFSFRAGSDLVYDPAGHALLGVAQPAAPARGGLLFAIDLATARVKTVLFEQPPVSLSFGPGRRLYVGVSDARRGGNLLAYDAEVNACLPVPAPGPEAGYFPNALASDPAGGLVICTENDGLLALEASEAPAINRRYAERLRPAATEPFPALYAFHRLDSNRVGVGTDAGLRLLGADGDERIDRGNGLSSNVVYGILPDSVGGLWLSTQHGITHLPADRRPGGARRYYRADGLANDEFLPRAYLKSRSGYYFFGGVNGLTGFRDEDFAVSARGAEVMLTGVTILGRASERSLTRDLDQLRQVTVFAREKGVAVSFTVPAGQLPGGGRFRYRLEGFNDDWVELVNERTVRFNNLASGNYRLRIQAAGPNGNYGTQERALLVNVRQYMIEKLWFQVLIILAFLGLIFYILQRQLRERLRNEQLRTQLSANIHDEVSGLLAGITLQAELLQNRTEDEKLRTRLQRVGDAGRQAMSKMSDVIWSIDSRRDTIGNLLQRMREHADEVLLPLDIRYEFRDGGLNPEARLAGNVRQDIYFIFKEAVNNVARHSGATRVEIEVEQFAQYFEILVRDNGRGATLPEGGIRAQKTGQGKDNMRMRAERLGGNLTIDEEAGYTLRFRMRRIG